MLLSEYRNLFSYICLCIYWLHARDPFYLALLSSLADYLIDLNNLTPVILWAEWLALLAAPLSFNRQTSSQVWGTKGDFK